MTVQEKKSFYFGVRICGCHTASMVDDEQTTPDDVLEFAMRMRESGRRMIHKRVTRREFMQLVAECPHKKGQMELKAAAIGSERHE